MSDDVLKAIKALVTDLRGEIIKSRSETAESLNQAFAEMAPHVERTIRRLAA